MKKAKFLLSIILCVVIVGSLFGCTTGNGGETTTESPGTTETPGTTAEAVTTEGGMEATVYYDDYLTKIGEVSAGAENVNVQGDSLQIVEVGNVKHFRVVGMGTSTVSDGTNTVKVNVEKARLNIVVIMGQSNSGNHFDNATSDIKCPRGTAYWWGNGQGLNATAPVNFTQATKGFHSPLLAELYAQSAANGTPEKNVLVWHEGGLNGEGTSKNGSPITGWAKSATDASGTDFTVKLVNNCVKYYQENSDKYEIVSKGAYWLQGEGDGVRGMNPTEYTGCFMAMWNKLKTEAGLEYMAILRVRRGGDQNTLNNDINYSTTSASQYALANKYDDIYMATTITEYFTGAPTEQKTIDISKYITLMEQYSGAASHNDSYGNAATYADGKLTTTMKTLFGSNNNNHYGKFGYALIGADAAYNMYNALHGKDYSITQADSSGSPLNGKQTITKAGGTVSIDITDMSDDLSFYATPGSVSGTISIKVTSKDKDISAEAGVINTEGASFGCVNVKTLKTYDDVKIAVTYTPKDGTAGTVTYTIVDNSIDIPNELTDSYTWDFNEDLYARDNNGNIVNGINTTPLHGSYELNNGILILTKAQLEFIRPIELKKENNWIVEIKFGDCTGAIGFILATEKSNVLGNKAFSCRGGRFNISDYDSKGKGSGYYNYWTTEGTITTGCVMKIVNTYDAATGKSVMSLWKDGVLIAANMQEVGGDYNGGSTADLSQYDVYADFLFAYIGCERTNSDTFLATQQIDYIKVDSNIK